MIIKIIKYIFNKKIWFSLSIIFFVITLKIITPKPYEKIDLTPWKNSQINNNELGFSGKISESLTGLFSVPILYKKYDIVFENTSDTKYDEKIIIRINKNSDFASIANKYFGEPFTNKNDEIQYKIEEGQKITIGPLLENDIINYDTWIYSENIGEECYRNFGQETPKDGCPLNNYSIINFYAKQNALGWWVSTFTLFLISITFLSILRSVWENK